MSDIDINRVQQNIKELQDQNAIDFQQWKRLGQEIERLEGKIKTSDKHYNLLMKMIKADYEKLKEKIIEDTEKNIEDIKADYNSLKKVIIDENVSVQLNKKIEEIAPVVSDGFKWKELDNGYISIIMDDNREDVKNVANICMEYNIPLCCSVIGALVRTRLDDLKYIQDGFGGEILCHGYNSTFLNPSSNNGADYKREILTGKEELNNYGLNVYGLKKPGNSIYTGYEQMIKDNYLYGTNLFGNEATYGNDCDPYSINVIYLGSQTEQQLKTLMDNAIKNKKWVLFYGHTIDGSEDGVTEDKLRYVCNYAVNHGLKGITLRDFYYKFGSYNFNARDKFLNNTIDSLTRIKSVNNGKHYLVLQANNDIVISNTGTIDTIVFNKLVGNGINFNDGTGQIQIRKKALYKISIEYHMTSANEAVDYNGQIGFYVTGGGIDNLHGKYNLDSYGKYRTYTSSYIVSKNYDDILLPKIFKNIPTDIVIGKFSRLIIEEL